MTESSESEDDYMTMTLPGGVVQTEEETIEEEVNSRVPHRDKTLHKGLTTSLFEKNPESKGLKIMKMMGFKPDESSGIKEPVGIEMRQDRRGIGSVSEKRKQEIDHEQSIEATKKAKTDYRMRIGEEMKIYELEKDIMSARAVLMNLVSQELDKDLNEQSPESLVIYLRKPIREYQEAKEMKRLQENRWYGLDLDHGLKSDCEDQKVITKNKEIFDKQQFATVADYDECDFEEEEKFESLPLQTKREKIIQYLRDQYFYCFYCGTQYCDSDDLANCPGPNETDHERLDSD